MNWLTTRLAIAPLMLSSLAACGDSAGNRDGGASAGAPASAGEAPQSPAAARTTDLCTLLTDEEFQQATGFAVRSKKSFPGEVPGCEWQLQSNGAGVHNLSATLRYTNGRQRFDFVTQSMTAVADLGDAAAKNGGNINGTVWAVKADTLLTLNYALPVTTTDPDPVVIPLGRLILSRQ